MTLAPLPSVLDPFALNNVSYCNHMQKQTQITCETLKEEYQALQDIADDYRAILMSEGKDSEKTKKARIAFDTATGNLREHIQLYKEQQEGIFRLSADYRSGKKYLEALQEKGYEVTEYAEGILNQLTDIPEEQVRLKKVTVEDLGLSPSATIEEILAVAETKGLKPCPPWVGPQYRMQCKDDENTAIGMEPMTGSDGDTYIFYVDRYNGGRWLGGDHTNPRWYSDDEFLFVSSQDSP